MSKFSFHISLSAMLFALCLSAEAQQPTKVPRIGFLSAFSRSDNNDQLVEAFRQGLREFGYLEGKNIVIEYRYAEGTRERLPDLAAELVRSKVDVIVATTAPGIEAAKTATKIIPIVMVAIGRDPVEAGLVDSLARPGGNVTGMTSLGAAISGKRLELFKEILPKISRVALLYDPANQGNVSTAKEVQKAAHPLGLTIQSIEVRSTDDFERVFAALKKDRPDGLYVSGGQLTNAKDKLIAEFALKSRLPSTYSRREAVAAGGLMSYGVDLVDLYRRAATYVDKIIKGAKPADLPVERPRKFELVINLKTAKQIGLTIPQAVLYQADKVIK